MENRSRVFIPTVYDAMYLALAELHRREFWTADEKLFRQVQAHFSVEFGLIEGSGNMRYAQTMAFTTLVFFSLFTVFNARSDERSAFVGLFSNKWLWGAVLLSLVLQVAVIYVPFLQQAFSTASLSFGDWLLCAAVASSVLWLRELSKMVTRLTVNNRFVMNMSK